MSGMLKTARYSAHPHAKARNHKIPDEIVGVLTGASRTLDGKRCLFEIMVVSHSDKPQVLPPVILAPTSGNEVFVGKRACKEYPDTFSADQYLVVGITPL